MFDRVDWTRTELCLVQKSKDAPSIEALESIRTLDLKKIASQLRSYAYLQPALIACTFPYGVQDARRLLYPDLTIEVSVMFQYQVG